MKYAVCRPCGGAFHAHYVVAERSLFGAATLLLAALLGCEPAAETPEHLIQVSDASGVEDVSADVARRIETFCSDCHALPRPESFARDRWHYEVRRGYEFYAKSGRNDLDVPPLRDTLDYYRARAPEQLTFSQGGEAAEPPPVNFQQENLYLDSAAGSLPEIAQLRWAQLTDTEKPLLLASDMRYGYVVGIDLARENRSPPRFFGLLRNPGRIEVCDLDGEGTTDLVVADLGSYLPADHDRGRVVWLKANPASGDYETIELAADLGRVADVRAADIDGDGRLDLVIAEFGWRDTGRLLWMRNVSESVSEPQFEIVEIDDLPGAIGLRIHDFTGDGRPDLAVLFSQEYECVDLFVNLTEPPRPGRPSRQPPFVRRNLWSAPDLTFGSSSIELADLNQDGKLDLLFTNGDTFDNDYAAPWHGVQWLQNQGDGRFEYRRLTDMLGAYAAVPGDFDRDGDLDVVVVSRLPPKLQPANLQLAQLSSIVLMRQIAPGEFARHTLQRGSPYYPTVAYGDFDNNGAIDFAVGSGPYVAESRQSKAESHYLTVWWNETEPK